MHDPDILILDEPLNGADPRQRVHFKRLLQQLASEGRTILISSHILEEVEELAETVLLIVNGKLAASGGFRAIRAALNQRPYHVRVVSDQPRELAAGVVKLASVDAVHIDPDGALVVLSRNVLDLQLELPKLAQQQGIRLAARRAAGRFARERVRLPRGALTNVYGLSADAAPADEPVAPGHHDGARRAAGRSSRS